VYFFHKQFRLPGPSLTFAVNCACSSCTDDNSDIVRRAQPETVVGTVHLAYAAGAQQGDDFVGTQFGARKAVPFADGIVACRKALSLKVRTRTRWSPSVLVSVTAEGLKSWLIPRLHSGCAPK
jgi:hypothetical protein